MLLLALRLPRRRSHPLALAGQKPPELFLGVRQQRTMRSAPGSHGGGWEGRLGILKGLRPREACETESAPVPARPPPTASLPASPNTSLTPCSQVLALPLAPFTSSVPTSCDHSSASPPQRVPDRGPLHCFLALLLFCLHREALEACFPYS